VTGKMDRRQLRTKQLLRKALMELIEEKGAEDITVTDIANRADINRGTFYLHYRDASDMLTQIKEEVFEKLMALLRQLDIIEMMGYAIKDEAYPKAVLVFEECARNADFFKVIFGPRGDPEFMLRIKNTVKAHFESKLTYWQPEESKMLVPLDFLLAYMSSANLGVLTHWIESGMRESPQQAALNMMRLINYGPLTATGLREKFGASPGLGR